MLEKPKSRTICQPWPARINGIKIDVAVVVIVVVDGLWLLLFLLLASFIFNKLYVTSN